jgi:phosphoribosylaminoimidazole-succinocarboxamide synthase
MDQQRIFLSAVSSEFRTAREALGRTLDLPGLRVREQASFRQEPGSLTLLDKPHDYIKDCTIVVCLIGIRAGSGPRPTESERYRDMLRHGIDLTSHAEWSYTQWEVFFALHYGRNMVTFRAVDDYVPEKPGVSDPRQALFVEHLVTIPLQAAHHTAPTCAPAQSPQPFVPPPPPAIPPRHAPDRPVRGTNKDSVMARRRQLYEGKAKILFEGPEPGTLVQYFKDDATAGNGAKKGIITGKGVLNNRISEYLMQRLAEIGIPTHFVRRLNMREQLIREVEIIPLEVVIRNVAAGSIATRLGIEEGTRLPRSIIEYYLKNDALNDPMVSEEHITCFGWAGTADLDDMVALSLRINDFLCGLFLGVGITLVDFKLEFGRLWENDEMRIILADEISPDNCRLWDTRTNEKLDKDRFRRDLGKVEEAYQEVAKRLGILPEAGVRDLKGPEAVQ